MKIKIKTAATFWRVRFSVFKVFIILVGFLLFDPPHFLILGKTAGTFSLYRLYSWPNSSSSLSSSSEIIKEYWIRKNENVVAAINKTLVAPAIKTIPKYINMFRTYSGFLTTAYGPEVHSLVAPTFRVRVSPPACETAHVLISSPAKSNVIPPKTIHYGNWIVEMGSSG